MPQPDRLFVRLVQRTGNYEPDDFTLALKHGAKLLASAIMHVFMTITFGG